MDAVLPRPKRSLGRRVREWAHRVNLERRVAITLMLGALASGLMTYLVLTDFWDWDNRVSERVISWLILADLFFVLSLGTVIARHAVGLWVERRKGLVGARLHSRLVLLFGVVALIPAITVSVFSTAFLNYGLDVWFGDKIKEAVESSLNVSKSYMLELQQRIANDSVSIANEIQQQGWLATLDPSQLNVVLNRQLKLRDLSEGVILDRQRQILAHGEFSLSMEFDLDLPEVAFRRADDGEAVIFASPFTDRVRALVALDGTEGLYLYTGRLIDEGVLASVRGNENAVRLYRQLEDARSRWQITVAAIFAVLALLLLLAAIWIAISSASQLVKPITRLVSAAQRLGGGDLSARAKIGRRDDELTALTRTFNTMAQRLQSQQVQLLAANEQVDSRRRFTELVLAGVSAGVIGLNERGEIELPNRSASELLGVNLSKRIGEPLDAVIPEMAALVETARARSTGNAEGEVHRTEGPITRTFHVRVVCERGEGDDTQIVVTFDDVTELLSAQRKAAWADIARRIAHEIKNPLTPIQLSAERLKRKYLREIKNDPETFAVCTDTIVRQVGDIGRMVDEFSAFARMPAPVLKPEDVAELARQALFLQQNANQAINYSFDTVESVVLNCDASQVTRALTNLLQNAADSIEGRLEDERQDTQISTENRLTSGRIHLWIRRTPEGLIVGIDDNGRGLPLQGREKLTEPYVTTRTKGTGLGLAIVKKIMEDHGGKLLLLDGEQGGASVRLIFPAEALAQDKVLKTARA